MMERKTQDHCKWCKKIINNIPHSFMEKKQFNKIGIQGNHFNIIKVIDDNLIANRLHSDEKLEVFLLRLGLRQGCSLLPLPFHIVQEVLARTIRQEREIKKKKNIQIGKEKGKLSLFIDDMI